MPEATRFEATGRAGFHLAASARPYLIDRAGVCVRNAAIERTAAAPFVDDEAEVRWTLVDDGEFAEEHFAHPEFVGLEQAHGLRRMVAAASARDTVCAVRIRVTRHR